MDPSLRQLLAELEARARDHDAQESDHDRKMLSLEAPTAQLLEHDGAKQSPRPAAGDRYLTRLQYHLVGLGSASLGRSRDQYRPLCREAGTC